MKKSKRLRLENGLTQEELANRCELSKGFISQVERDMTSPSIASLVDILESLGTNLNEFFSENEEEKLVFTPEDAFENIDEELGYILDWVIPNAQKKCDGAYSFKKYNQVAVIRKTHRIKGKNLAMSCRAWFR